MRLFTHLLALHRTFLALLVAFSIALPAQAANSLDDLLRQVKSTQGEEGRRNQERERKFLAAKNQQQRLLNEAKAKLKQTQSESERLKNDFESNEKQLTELSEALHQATGTLGEMFGVVRQSAGDLKAVINTSLVSAQFKDRTETLETLANSKALPNVSELEHLWFTLQQEMTESGKVSIFNTTVTTPDGSSQQQQVTRIGNFTAIAAGQYLNYMPESQQFMILARQPGEPHRSLAENFNKTQQSHTAITIDPTRGAILGMLVQNPNTLERVQQGGLIGYIILALGLLGLLIAIERLIVLFFVGNKINRQLKDVENPTENNPLGRVLATFKQNSHNDLETMEQRLDEAILKETPKLNRGIRIVKLLSAIAPLLGLLGTVTGMIATFQSITLFGTGDPKLMASGISQALVTTMLGLIVAVPLLFLHAGIAARSQRFIQILDEQSAGLIARKLQ